MASSSTNPNILTTLSVEENLVHEFDHISLSPSTDLNAFCLIFKLLTPKSVKPAWIEKAMFEAWTLRFPVQFFEYHSGLFLSTFQCDGDRRRVLEDQPWHFDKFVIIFTHPDVSPTPTPNTIRYTPFWVQAHNIPFGRKSPQLAQLIADELGDLIEIYPLSLLESFGPYLRIECCLISQSPFPTQFLYFCGLMDHTYNKCSKYLLRCDNFPSPPLLEYRDSLRVITHAHLKKNPFEISNSTPFEELFPHSSTNDHSLQHAMNQFLRMDTPASHTVTSTTPLTSAPMAFPQQPSSSTIPPPIITTSIITHTKKGKGIALTTYTTPHPLATELRVWSLTSLALNLLLLLLLEPGGSSLARLLRLGTLFKGCLSTQEQPPVMKLWFPLYRMMIKRDPAEKNEYLQLERSSPNQSAFLAGRQITDNILIANEIIHAIHSRKSGKIGWAAIKLDMEKAFDRVEWSFITKFLYHVGVPPSFVSLISKCLSTITYQLSLNGTLSNVFSSTRGIWQGDPLAPYLFLIVAEGLFAAIRLYENAALFSGLQICRGAPSLSHLLFADDSMVISPVTSHSSEAINAILLLYHQACGQLVNRDKSSIFFSSNTSLDSQSRFKSTLQQNGEANGYNSSFTWKSLLWHRQLLKKGLVWKISSGRDIHISATNWIPRRTQFSKFPWTLNLLTLLFGAFIILASLLLTLLTILPQLQPIPLLPLLRTLTLLRIGGKLSGPYHSLDYKDAQILSSTLSLPQPSSPHALHHILQEDTPALFVDAALNHEDAATGLGLVFRKGPHQILNSATFCKVGASTPIFGEAQSLYEGIQWCISSQLIPRFIFTDCVNLVTKVNGTWHDHSTLSSLIVKIRLSLSNFAEAPLLHLSRQFNKNAHSLAKAALRLRDEELEESF
uniref:Reverse transcriptase domain-containing protein n=1 Tax=Cannabis sativa TaxID=3483 RepID=A0A803PTL7_CANSA